MLFNFANSLESSALGSEAGASCSARPLLLLPNLHAPLKYIFSLITQGGLKVLRPQAFQPLGLKAWGILLRG